MSMYHATTEALLAGQFVSFNNTTCVVVGEVAYGRFRIYDAIAATHHVVGVVDARVLNATAARIQPGYNVRNYYSFCLVTAKGTVLGVREGGWAVVLTGKDADMMLRETRLDQAAQIAHTTWVAAGMPKQQATLRFDNADGSFVAPTRKATATDFVNGVLTPGVYAL